MTHPIITKKNTIKILKQNATTWKTHKSFIQIVDIFKIDARWLTYAYNIHSKMFWALMC